MVTDLKKALNHSHASSALSTEVGLFLYAELAIYVSYEIHSSFQFIMHVMHVIPVG